MTATDLPLPGLLPTPVPVADEVEHFMEVCAQSNLLSLYLPLVSLQPMEQDGTKDSHLTMMERRPWTQRINRRLPKRFRDELPQPPPPISEEQNVGIASSPASETTQRTRSTIQHVFTSVKNAFGLFRRYQSTSPPTYDPDNQLTTDNLSNIPSAHGSPTEAPPDFYPYPN